MRTINMITMREILKRHTKRRLATARLFMTLTILSLSVACRESMLAADRDIFRASNIESLSNNSIMTIFQDHKGFVWLGTYDGLNRYDGRNVRVFRHEFDNPNSLSGNVINELHIAEKGYIWVLSTMGLDKFSTDDFTAQEHHTDIRGTRDALFTDTLGNAFVVAPDNIVKYYDLSEKKFRIHEKPAFVADHLGFCLGAITDTNTLWLFPNEDFAWKIHFDFSKGYSPGEAVITWQKVKLGQSKTIEAYRSNHGFYLVAENGNLFHIDDASQNVQFIRNIANEKNRYGKISSILRYGDDILISFIANGIIRLNSDDGYIPEVLSTEVGVFKMIHDHRQALVWVGTDGRGLYKMCDLETRYKSLHSSQVPGLTKPIRAFFTDSYKNLWIGTKGDGLIILEDYPTLPTKGTIPHERIIRYGQHPGSIDDLPSNQIFAIRESRFYPGRIWIAGQGPGISYINGCRGKIVNIKHHDLVDVHDFFEESDSVIWLASTTRGLIKVVTDGSQKVLKTDIFTFKRNNFSCNEIYSIAYDGNKGLYIGCRGGIGIVRFDLDTNEYDTLDNVNDCIPGLGDIISLAYSGDGNLYLGSSIGGGIVDCHDAAHPKLVKLLSNKDGLANDMVHSIIPADNGDIWMSTNKGITRYSPSTGTIHNINRIAGDIAEFCDNSGYISQQNGDVIFGALNGIAIVKSDPKNGHLIPDSHANIVFTGMTVNGSDYLPSADELKDGLRFSHDDDVITISFAALDYIQSDYINYWYKIEGHDNKWINLGNTPSVTLTNLPPGKYKLFVRYEIDGRMNNSEELVLPMKMSPAWYASGPSYFIYVVTFILIILFIIHRSRSIYNNKKLELERQIYTKEQERLFADRKAFFTNITHEFCSPLTMIMGICDTLQKKIDESDERGLRPYVDTLYRNSKNLNDLVQEILDERYMDEAMVRLHVQPISLENIFKRWICVYEEIARQNNIEFVTECDRADLRWNTDVSCMSKIITNLMSNAFKYTPAGGKVRVTAKELPDGILQIEFYNTGQGISEENRKQLFNKYAIFNNMETNSYCEMSSSHGLGLFICHEMAIKLGATIDIDSVEGEYVRFIVSFPHLDIQQGQSNEETNLLPVAENQPRFEGKPEILVVDDNPDILWLVSSLLSSDYVVTPAKDAAEARKVLQRQIPALIITDIMMPDESGIDFIKYIRCNKFAQNVQIIILSAKISEEDMIEGYKYGADAYVTKPFNGDVLKTIVARLLQRTDSEKNYYRSPLSAVTIDSGQEISNEGKLFFDRMRMYISDNFDDESKLTPEAIAEAMNVDTRTLYRRFKKHTPYTPKEFVKKIRYAFAANLILTTDLTVQEIIYRIGMSNKTVFYSDFKKIYGVTPKEYRNSGSDKAQD